MRSYIVLSIIIIAGCATPFGADFDGYEEVGPFITSNPIDLETTLAISKFRSCEGHDYSGYDSHGVREPKSSMKHYMTTKYEYLGTQHEVAVFAPFDGKIIKAFDESFPTGQQVWIRQEGNDWNFVFFHIDLLSEIKPGVEVKSGQLIGHADMEVGFGYDFALKRFSGINEVIESPFEYMVQSVLAEYNEVGITTENIIIPRIKRDSEKCDFENSVMDDWVFFGTTELEKEETKMEYLQSYGYQKDTSDKPDIYSQVWSQHSPQGESFEFKVNCGSNYRTLEECFLWDIDSVRVITPNSETYNLEKDFNINDYSGEITRRWVLYGPPEASIPETGVYYFEFFKDNQVEYRDEVRYTKSKVSYPTNVKWERIGSDLKVMWDAPEVDSSMQYKVILWEINDTPDTFVSDIFNWDATEATLKDVPLIDGGEYEVNVAVYFNDGYAYSRYEYVKW